MTCIDAWLLLCMAIVFLAVSEYALILGIWYGKRNEAEKMKKERFERAEKIDSWAFKIFIGLYILVVVTYFYGVNSYAY